MDANAQIRPPSRRKRRWRVLLRVGKVLAVALAPTLACCWYGWRCGLTPLPDPLPGVTVQAPPRVFLADLTPTNYWYWARVLGMAFQLGDTNLARIGTAVPPRAPAGFIWRDTNAARFTASLQEWSRCGPIAFTNRDQFSRWLAERPAIDECYRGALENPDGIGAELADGLRQQLTAQSLLLAAYPLWLAQESERQGRATDAFDHLLAGWRLSARAAARRGVEQGSFWALATCWRRLALTGPPLEAGEAQRLLNALAGATNLLPALDAAYAQRAVPECLAELMFGLDEPDWEGLGGAFKEGLSDIAEEAKERAERLVDRLMGNRVSDYWQPEGLGHLALPFKGLLTACQRAAARDEDFRQLQTAYFSQVLARLRQGKLREADEFDAALRAAHPGSGLKSFFDRPAVWRLLDAFERPSYALDNLIRWRCNLETCRLTLALRLYRDRHGAWPERLEDLVPELLPALPMEPCSGQPFRYQKKGGTWLIRAGVNHHLVRPPSGWEYAGLARYGVPPKTPRPGLDVPGQPPLCSSEEVKEAAEAWVTRQKAVAQATDRQMTLRYGTTVLRLPSAAAGSPATVMMRPGLAPNGVQLQLTPSNTIIAVPVSAPATNSLATTNSADPARTNQSSPLPQAR